MRSRSLVRLSCALFALVLLSPQHGKAQSASVRRFPADRAVSVNPDTHLVLTFSSAPAIGKSGQVRIYDAADHSLVDTLDLSIPAGPDPSSRATTAPTPAPTANATGPTSPATTTPAVRTTPADLNKYQFTTIGGLANFHFYPIIVHGNVATIYPHNNMLHYGHKYIVQIDPGVLTPAGRSFAGFTSDTAWTFTTKAAGPAANATRVVVAADGSGDFNTVQGAADYLPDNPSQRVTIFIKNGTYEEIVFFRNKANLTFRGEDRDKVQIGYGNNSGFNPPIAGPYRRCAFTAYSSTGIVFENFSVSNYYSGQAEGLFISGSKNIVSHVNIKGSGDALDLRGSAYITDSSIIGDLDTILAYGPAFFNHCELSSVGAFMWIRNTAAVHGNVFVNSTFIGLERPMPATLAESPAPATSPSTPPRTMGATFARLPNNHGTNFPYAEVVLINCHLKGIPPAGWGPLEDTLKDAHTHLWEFNSTDLNGKPIDTSQRNPISKQLTMPQDAQTIADYSNPAFVLGGWTPVIDQ